MSRAAAIHIAPTSRVRSARSKDVRACSQPVAIIFVDDGVIPNNLTLPFVLYREAIDVTNGTPRR